MTATNAARRHTRSRSGARLLGDRGAAAVEFALVVPLLVLILFGIMDFSRAMQSQATLSAAAREGARVMALTNDPAAARTAVSGAAGSLQVEPDRITVDPAVCPPAPDADPDADLATDPATVPADLDASPGRDDMDITQTVTVTVTYEQPLASGVLGAGVELTGTAVMRCGG